MVYAELGDDGDSDAIVELLRFARDLVRSKCPVRDALHRDGSARFDPVSGLARLTDLSSTGCPPFDPTEGLAVIAAFNGIADAELRHLLHDIIVAVRDAAQELGKDESGPKP